MTRQARTPFICGCEGGLHIPDARGDRSLGDELVALGGRTTGRHDRSTGDQHRLTGPGERGSERLDGFGVGLGRGLADAGHDEGQVNDAVAVERAGAQHLRVIEVAAQHLGAHVGDGPGGGVRAGQPENLMAGADEFGDEN
jgi:hypothetical protein